MRNSEYYKKAYDEVHAPAALLGKVMDMKKERKEIKKKNTVKKWLTAAAAMAFCFVASNGICYAATGKTWVQKVTVYLDGQPCEQEVTFHQEGDVLIGELEVSDAENPVYAVLEAPDDDISGDVGNSTEYTYTTEMDATMGTELVQENGRVWLVINGDNESRVDITEDFADGSASGIYAGFEGLSLRYTVTGTVEEYSVELACE
ncbi:MAG: hypothetical protein HDT40_10630 [Lachnospiraceae bacterium]|nr:hypothetical protein [Lachnospiraceae bacterium]